MFGHNIFELLVLKHDHAYVNVEYVRDDNDVAWDGQRYTKYVICGIALLYITKFYLRTTAFVLKIRELILEEFVMK